ncbi:vitronectin [Rhynchocyon petersi]
MAPPRPILMLALLAWAVLADQESCKGRCTEGFNANRKCQCDDLCSYYQSCCVDYVAECKPQVTRGDVFTMPEDEYGVLDYPEETKENTSTHVQPVTPIQSPLGKEEQSPVPNPEEEDPKPVEDPEVMVIQGAGTSDLGVPAPPTEKLCSEKPFDAFTDLKNGSIFAFRGLYCYELDEMKPGPGKPKLIRDVWGIEGPIDAAFTRINCQGKTYLFKGSQYWRFEDGVLDPSYPRNISEGFQGIPDNVDAAFALPAHSYNGRERVYFFKGKQYWEYEFQQQPSQEECEASSPSAVFQHFAFMQRSSWEDIFELLFWGKSSGGASEPMLISQGWPGVPEPVDATMAGRIYISGSSWTPKLKSTRRNRKRYRSRSRSRSGRGRSQKSRRPSRSVFLSLLPGGDSEAYYDDISLDWLVPASCEPVQSVFFFSGGEYYRVNLRTRRVDIVTPPYPRSIAQYWLDCSARIRQI